MKSFFLLILIYTPLSLGKGVCDFKMNETSFYSPLYEKYGIQLSINEICSSNTVYKRKLSGVDFNLHTKNDELINIEFDEGYWMPSQQKFLLTKKEKIKHPCFKGATNLTVDFKKGMINSIAGHYLSLKSDTSLNVNCNEI